MLVQSNRYMYTDGIAGPETGLFVRAACRRVTRITARADKRDRDSELLHLREYVLIHPRPMPLPA